MALDILCSNVTAVVMGISSLAEVNSNEVKENAAKSIAFELVYIELAYIAS